MKIRLGVSEKNGIESVRFEDEKLLHRCKDRNSFSHDGWTINIQNQSLVVQRPKIGKCPAVSKKFALQDGTIYLKAKQKVAEAKFAFDDFSLLIMQKYGIHEICYADPNRTYRARFRENPNSPEGNTIYELVWTHTDGKTSTIKRSYEQHTEETVHYGHLKQFVGNYYGFYVDKEVKRDLKVDECPISMREAVKEFNNDNAKDLTVSDAKFAVVYALDPTYQFLNDLCVLYTTEKDHRRIMEMLDQKLTSDRLLHIRGFNLHDMAHDNWGRG